MGEERVVDANMLARSAGIDPHNIQQEFVNLPGELAYWCSQYASATEDFLTKKAAFEVTEARLAANARTTLEVQGKKATEATIMESTRTSPEWLAVRTALIRAEGNKVRIHGIVSAVEAKRDMLISLGSHIRAEMAAFPSVGAAAAARQGQQHAHSNLRGPLVASSVTDWVEDLKGQTR